MASEIRVSLTGPSPVTTPLSSQEARTSVELATRQEDASSSASPALPALTRDVNLLHPSQHHTKIPRHRDTFVDLQNLPDSSRRQAPPTTPLLGGTPRLFPSKKPAVRFHDYHPPVAPGSRHGSDQIDPSSQESSTMLAVTSAHPTTSAKKGYTRPPSRAIAPTALLIAPPDATPTLEKENRKLSETIIFLKERYNRLYEVHVTTKHNRTELRSSNVALTARCQELEHQHQTMLTKLEMQHVLVIQLRTQIRESSLEIRKLKIEIDRLKAKISTIAT